MGDLKLYMLLLGCKPPGRNTEQHDILFAAGSSLKETISQIHNFWPGPGKIHLDAWREVTSVSGFSIVVKEKTTGIERGTQKLFFLNLGGYKPGVFEEFHYKVLGVHEDKISAIKEAKETTFFMHNTSSHIDDKYGLDVDDVYEVEDILPLAVKEKYALQIVPLTGIVEDKWHIGYTKLSSL